MNHMKMKIITSTKERLLVNTNSKLFHWRAVTDQSQLVFVNTLQQ